jgi:serine/threonine protein kinase
MVTEYCTEGDLSQWLKKIKCGEIEFNERVTLAIMLDVARGMAFNDVRHILHRDLKPANIFLEANCRRAKVGDFGLAKIVERIATNPQQLNQSRTYYDVDRKGSMVFMAPEVLQHGRCDRAADVYSFGILLHNVFVSFNEEESFDIERVREYAAQYQLRFVAAFVSMLLFVPDFRPRFPPQEATRMSSVVYKGISSLAEQCWQRDPSQRPSFKDICSVLSQLIQHVASQPSTPNGQGQTNAPSVPVVANPVSLPSSPTAVFGAPARRTPSTDPVSPAPSPPTGAATRQQSAPAPAWIVLGPSLAATSPSPLDLTAALVSSSSLIRGNGGEQPFSASPMTNTSMTSPNGISRFDLIATLNSMREDLHIPDDVDIPTAVAIIAENLDMVEQIKDMKPRKRQIQCLWRQFVDSEDEAARMWPYAPQFSLMEVVRRMQTDMRLSMELTVAQIVRDAAATLMIDDECSQWSTVKLKAKRVAVELGYLPEELLPLLEAELSTQVV